MLLLLVLPILTAGFLICKQSPPHFFRLHRYEGQLLYLKSASLGLLCALIAYALLTLFMYLISSSLKTQLTEAGHDIVEITQHILNLSDKNAKGFAAVVLMTITTLTVAKIWIWFDLIRLKLLSMKHKVDASIIVMGRVLADSPLDALLYSSYAGNDVIMLTLSNRKVYVGVVNNMGEPNEIEGFDQEVSLVPILSGYRDKDDLCVNWTTTYDDVDYEKDFRIVIRQELIESANEFDFDIWEAFVTQNSPENKKVKVTFNPSSNSFSWTLS